MKINLNHTINTAKQAPLVFKMSVDIAPADRVVGVFGRSGAGKTTLLKILAGLFPSALCTIEIAKDALENQSQPTKSQVRSKVDKNNSSNMTSLQFVNTSGRHNPCVYIGADSPLFDHVSVGANLDLVIRHSESRVVGSLSLFEAIELCDISTLLSQYPWELSSGEKQRVCFARGLLSGKKILLLDEAFSALDWTTRKLMHLVLQQLVSQRGYRAIMVSHSLQELSLCALKVLNIENGAMTRQMAIEDMLDSHTKQTPSTNGEQDNYFCVVKASYSHIDPDEESLQVYCLNPHNVDEGKGALYVKAINVNSVFSSSTVQSLLEMQQNETRSFVLHANQISVSRHEQNQTSMLNCFEVDVSEIIKSSNGVLITGLCYGQTMRALITQKSFVSLDIQIGQTVFFLCKAL